jgi:pyruvate dehydrogenase E1 component
MNEIYTHPEMPTGTQEGIIRGIYPLKKVGTGDTQVQLLGSGTILRDAVHFEQSLPTHTHKLGHKKYNLEWC